MKVLVEGIGSMVFATQLKYYRELGWELIGIDVTDQSYGFYHKDIRPYLVPKYNDPSCFNIIESIIEKERVDLVFPTVNEGLLLWSKRKTEFKKKYGTVLMLSDEKTIETCTDKWKTFLFFKENNIPTPNTSLEADFELIKPRIGRGSTGIFKKTLANKDIDMKGYISQELVTGDEYTIDVLCDFYSSPIYIIPRKRLKVESGLSVQGITVFDEEIINYVKEIIKCLKPIGIINIQCFKNEHGIYFIEINPRIGGGSSLGFASSDNWFKAIEYFIEGREYIPQKVKYNNMMLRYYDEIIVSKNS